MDIIKEFQQYPKAWDAFLEWAGKNSFFFDAWHTEFVASQRYLLADMQAWLDSEGVYCVPSISITNKWSYTISLQTKGQDNYGEDEILMPLVKECEIDITETRPEALKAAVLKGCEIFENSKTK